LEPLIAFSILVLFIFIVGSIKQTIEVRKQIADNIDRRKNDYFVADSFVGIYLNKTNNITSEEFISEYLNKTILLYINIQDIKTTEGHRIIEISSNKKYQDKFSIKIFDDNQIITGVKKQYYLDIKVEIINITINEILDIECKVIELINNYCNNKALYDERL
jgi:hypothetical protein